jgi:predicted Ser/Thr protein kinase
MQFSKIKQIIQNEKSDEFIEQFTKLDDTKRTKLCNLLSNYPYFFQIVMTKLIDIIHKEGKNIYEYFEPNEEHLNEYTLPLYLEIYEEYKIENKVDEMVNLAMIFSNQDFYEISTDMFQYIISLYENHIQDCKNQIALNEESQKGLTIYNIIIGNSPIQQLQKKSIQTQFLRDYLHQDKSKTRLQLIKILLKRIHVPQSTKKYNKIKYIGRGGFGKVWLVKDENGNKYAMKEGDYKEMLHQSNLLKQINKIDPSPTNLKYVDFTNNGELIVQYLENYITLEDYFYTMDKATCQSITEKIETLIHNLNQKGVSHNDIKGANIMINPMTKDIKIIDFGISCLKKNDCKDRLNWTAALHRELQDLERLKKKCNRL